MATQDQNNNLLKSLIKVGLNDGQSNQQMVDRLQPLADFQQAQPANFQQAKPANPIATTKNPVITRTGAST